MRFLNGTAGLACVLTLLMTIKSHAAETKERVLWDASNPLGLEWEIVNDTVMGGVSSSRLKVDAKTAVFAGELSLENNGGFASVRSVPQPFSFPETAVKLVVRVRGDGRTYKFTARRDGSFDGVNYQHEIQTTAGEWHEVTLNLAGFRPSWRGRTVDEPALKAPDIHSIGFMVADKRRGPFKLEIDWVKLTE